jgi:hypothetical protein
MGQILQFIRPDLAFDPLAIDVLDKAYDMALAALCDGGQPSTVREVIAKRIISAAVKGERDPARLCAAALTAFNTDRLIR